MLQSAVFWCLVSPGVHSIPSAPSSTPTVTQYLNVVTDVTTIFVQTDKAIYKPGQLVHYRVFAVYPDLSMYQGRFSIEIRDPNGNVIQWRSGVEGAQGVAEGDLPLADQPVMGDWVIKVTIQDTVVGLRALTEFVHLAVPRGYDLHLQVRAPHVQADFDVTDSNALVLQTRDFQIVPSEVTFTATGRGVAVAELDVFFNVESKVGQAAFEVSTVLLDDYINSFKLMICTRWLLAGESGMAVQEVGIPSGFAPDMSSVGDVAGIKRAEQKGDYLDVYFDQVTKNYVCYTVMFDRQSKVANSQPSYVITQDYYQPGNRAVVSYQSLSLKNSEVCDVCPACCHQV
ncbi:hypothetical protein ACOMHN_007508 [Nucella lapillus]